MSGTGITKITGAELSGTQILMEEKALLTGGGSTKCLMKVLKQESLIYLSEHIKLLFCVGYRLQYGI